MARYKLGGGYGPGSGMVANGANIDNQLIVGKAGGQTIKFGTVTTNNGVLSPNPAQDGQLFYGTMTAPGYFQDTTTALGLDYWMQRSGKNGGGKRQVVTIANRGSSLNDDVCLGFEPAFGSSAIGGNSFSLARIEAIFASPNQTSFRHFVNLGGVSTEVFRLDGVLGVTRMMRGLQVQRASKSSAYPVTDADTLILADATGGAFDVTLPTAVGRDGQLFGVIRVSASNTVTVKSAAGALNGVAAATGIGLTSQYMVRWFISDGTNWFAVMGLL